jgi:superfamily II DNA or RNA helicase
MIRIEVGPMETVIRNWPSGDVRIRELREMCSFEIRQGDYAPTAFDPMVFNGRKYLIQSTGNTYIIPSGLLERVMPFFEAHKSTLPYELIIPERKINRTNLTYNNFQLRPYQPSAVMRTLYPPSKTVAKMGGIMQAATGAGKTAMAARMISLLKTTTLFVVHTKDLLMQAKKAFESFLGIKVGVIGAGKRDIQPVTVATIQSLQSGYDDLLSTVEFVMFDECHHVAAKTLYETAMKLKNVKCVVGLSASPWRDDNHDLMIEAICGPVRYVITASDLIDQGFLVPPEIVVYRRPLPANLKRMHIDAQSYQKAYRKVVVEDEGRNRLIQQIAKEQLAAGRRLLVLVRQVDHGQTLESMIPGSVFVEGNTKLADREKAFEDFRQGRIKCLIGTSLADEGVDIPNADALILAGAGSSSTRALQRIGRVIRCAPGKTSAFVADIVDEHKSFQRQFYARKKMYETERRFTIRTVNLADTV